MSRSKILGSVLGVVVVAVLIRVELYGNPQARSSPNTVLMGTVKSSDGKLMEGVAVSARAEGSTYTTSVYTDRNGEYFFPPLDGGQYKVWAQAVGFEQDRAGLTIVAGKRVQQTFTLKTLDDIGNQLSGGEWVASLPGDNASDRKMKGILSQECTQCHDLAFGLVNRFDAADWNTILTFMISCGAQGSYNPIGSRRDDMIDEYKEEVVSYLTRVRGPNSAALKYQPFPRPTGEATQVVVTDYDVPFGEAPDSRSGRHDGSDWAEGPPSSLYQGKTVHDVLVNNDGGIWFGDTVTAERSIAKLDPRTGQITNYKIVNERNNLALSGHSLRHDADGNIWFTNNGDGGVVKFDPKTEKFTRFPSPSGRHVGGGYTLTMDSKDTPWFSTSVGVAKLDPITGQYTDYKAVTQGDPGVGVDVDSQGSVWFSQVALDRLGIVNPLTGKVSEVVLGSQDPKELDIELTGKDYEMYKHLYSENHAQGPLQKGPDRLAADRDGDTVWVPYTVSDRLAKIDIHTKKITVYPFPHRYVRPYAAVVDKNHMVWVSSLSVNRIFKFNPQTERFTEYEFPTRATLNRNVAVDNSTDPPTIWVAHFTIGKLSRMQFRTPQVSR